MVVLPSANLSVVLRLVECDGPLPVSVSLTLLARDTLMADNLGKIGFLKESKAAMGLSSPSMVMALLLYRLNSSVLMRSLISSACSWSSLTATWDRVLSSTACSVVSFSRLPISWPMRDSMSLIWPLMASASLLLAFFWTSVAASFSRSMMISSTSSK